MTFTNSATAEMRERILNAIYEKLDNEPDNENLQRQITLLNMASICTIDSFCLDVVRNNFFELDNVSPNFRIADPTEVNLLKEEVLDEIFEEKYENEDKEFVKLINTYTSYKDDTPLRDLILDIYKYIESMPYPKDWLEEKVEMFNIKNNLNQDFSKTPWGKSLIESVEDELKYDIECLKDVLNDLSTNEELQTWEQLIELDIKRLENLNENLDNWDNAFEIANNLNFERWSTKKISSEIKDQAKKIRDAVKLRLLGNSSTPGLLKKVFLSTSEETNKDIYEMYELLRILKNLIFEFDDKFSKEKRNKNMADFSDVQHFALNILLKKDENGNLVKTDVSKKYMEKFEEIAIDEYQDSNLIQEYLLNAVSRKNNVFMVGDVKQSIYRFRGAIPGLFWNKYKSFDNINKKNTEIGRKIQLFKNFRSRKNVLDFTNIIFQDIMSDKLGEIDYNLEEYLNYGADDYKDFDQDYKTEINIINLKEENTESETIDTEENKKDESIEYFQDIEIEAKFVAQRIKSLIDNRYQIYDRKNKTFRDAKYKDILILLRSTKDKANIFEQELINLGIPVFSDSTQDYLDTIEIQTIMNILKIIDNPMQDIPLVSTLRSNIFKFTDNDLVEIRLSSKRDNFYNTMLKAKINVNETLKSKIQYFLDKIDEWRKASEYLALDELIWKIYSDTGYYNFVGLMPNGSLRQANLKILFERAKKYESASFKGLYNFITFIENLRNSSGDMSQAKIIGENDDVVRIMSIHKSKGLESPIVILANANKNMNEKDINQNPVLLHQDLGIGMKYIDYNTQIKYDTLTRKAISQALKLEQISEEMRVLYVALTRAKEKLIITGVSKDIEKGLENIESEKEIFAKENLKINSILVKKYKSYLDWILLVYTYEKEKFNGLAQINIISKKELINKEKNKNENMDTIKLVGILEDEIKKIKNKNDLKEDIVNKIEFKYKNELATKIPSKSSVTEIKNNKNNDFNDNKIIEFEKPKFLNKNEKEKITAQEKGTLMHLILQKLNNNENYDLTKIEKLLENLVLKNIISEDEKKVINSEEILKYTKSKIWNMQKDAKEIYKEKPFLININADDIYNEKTDENVIVQGIIDLYFIDKDDNLILVDYKTDFVEEKNEIDLINKYKEQLNLYKKALECALNRKVDKTYIYSLYLGKEIML